MIFTAFLPTSFADLAKDDIPEGTLAHQNQEEVLIAAKRAKELVKQILTFGRKDEAQLIHVNINTIVQEVLTMSLSIPQPVSFTASFTYEPCGRWRIRCGRVNIDSVRSPCPHRQVSSRQIRKETVCM